jgi:Putative transposase
VRTILKSWVVHYNRGRPHSSLGPGIPEGVTSASISSEGRHQIPRGYRVVAKRQAETSPLLADGRVLYRLKHPWRDGSTHVLFEPLELVAKLAALVPPPRFNLVRYHGVLAPAARSRPEIVPPSPPRQAETSPHSGCRAHRRTSGDSPRPQSGKSKPRERSTRQGRSGWGQRRRNYSWVELMHRVWAIDVLECPRCLGCMRILAAIHPPDAIRGAPRVPRPAFAGATDRLGSWALVLSP